MTSLSLTHISCVRAPMQSKVITFICELLPVMKCSQKIHLNIGETLRAVSVNNFTGIESLAIVFTGPLWERCMSHEPDLAPFNQVGR